MFKRLKILKLKKYKMKLNGFLSKRVTFKKM